MVVAVIEGDALCSRVHRGYRVSFGKAHLPIPARMNNKQVRAESGIARRADIGGRPLFTLAIEIEGRLMQRIRSADAQEVGSQQCRHGERRADRHHPRWTQPCFDSQGRDQGAGGMAENDFDSLVSVIRCQPARLGRKPRTRLGLAPSPGRSGTMTRSP